MDNSDFLNEKRIEINLIDHQIIQLLERRMQHAIAIGKYKKERDLKILQEDRWRDMLKNYIEKGMRKGLSDNLIQLVFNPIHEESVRLQQEQSK